MKEIPVWALTVAQVDDRDIIASVHGLAWSRRWPPVLMLTRKRLYQVSRGWNRATCSELPVQAITRVELVRGHLTDTIVISGPGVEGFDGTFAVSRSNRDVTEAMFDSLQAVTGVS